VQSSRESGPFGPSEDDALRAVAVMEQRSVVDLDRATTIEAARLSILHRIAMADSVMLATAQRHRATLWGACYRPLCASIDYVHENVGDPVNKPRTRFMLHIILAVAVPSVAMASLFHCKLLF
jgi:hypothetical protein